MDADKFGSYYYMAFKNGKNEITIAKKESDSEGFEWKMIITNQFSIKKGPKESVPGFFVENKNDK